MGQDARCVCDEADVAHETFSIPSADGVTTIVGDVWTAPESAQGDQPRAVVQLVHGMAEHVGRYDEFARFLAARGYAVVGHDHIGHGRSVPSPSSWGVLDHVHGAEHLVTDVHRVRAWAQERFGGAPHLMFGHSMGSFVLRAYLMGHGQGLSGAVVCATGWQSPAALAFGRGACDVIGATRGWEHRSAFVHALADGAYERAFGPAEGGRLGWLTRDAGRRAQFAADPACGFTFSVAAYHELFRLVGVTQSRSAARGMQPDVPVLLIAGGEDPVGGRGRAVPKVAALMRASGVRDVRERIYAGARHELLNETNRAEVFADVLAFLDECAQPRQTWQAGKEA